MSNDTKAPEPSIETVDSTETINELLAQVACLSARLDQAEEKLTTIKDWAEFGESEVKHTFGVGPKLGAVFGQLAGNL